MKARSLLIGAVAALLALSGARLALGELEPLSVPERPPVFTPRHRSRVRKLKTLSVPAAGLGNPLAALDLKRQLDALRRAATLRVGGMSWRVGIAADPEFKYFFLAFAKDGGPTTLSAISTPHEAVHQGIVVRADATHQYRIKVKPKLTGPLRGSEVSVWPEGGDRKNAATWSSGELLDMLERRAAYVRIDDDEYYLAYLSDVDPRTGAPAGTRSFLFFQEGRFLAHAWMVPERQLAPDVPSEIELGGVRVTLLLRRGLLIVYPAP